MQDVNGGAQQEAQRDQAQRHGGNESRRGVALGWSGGGLFHWVLTTSTHEALQTLANGPRVVREAGSAVVAVKQVAGALAHRAVFPGEAQCARAPEVVIQVVAGAGVAAGAAGTVVNVGLAVRAGEAWQASAHDALTEVQAFGTCNTKTHRS